MNVLIARQMLGRAFDLCGGEFGLHRVNAIHPRLDRADRLEVLVKLSLVRSTQPLLQLLGVAESQIGDVSESCVGSGAEQPVVNLSRVPHGRGDMTCAVPGHIVEVDRFNVVFMIVAAQFQSRIRRCLANGVGGNVVQSSSERIGGVFYFKRSNTRQEAGRGLSM